MINNQPNTDTQSQETILRNMAQSVGYNYDRQDGVMLDVDFDLYYVHGHYKFDLVIDYDNGTDVYATMICPECCHEMTYKVIDTDTCGSIYDALQDTHAEHCGAMITPVTDPLKIDIATILIDDDDDDGDYTAEPNPRRVLIQWVQIRERVGILTFDGDDITDDHHNNRYITIRDAIEVVGHTWGQDPVWQIEWL